MSAVVTNFFKRELLFFRTKNWKKFYRPQTKIQLDDALFARVFSFVYVELLLIKASRERIFKTYFT